jgi:hypothetical protein
MLPNKPAAEVSVGVEGTRLVTTQPGDCWLNRISG